ncbi:MULTISPECIES: LPS translocon maturation chaperone LptM [unclassified Acinetobacter]|uniref:LPS translocon maturation chaperone LptM n=1 Tax=unclassified Acinetobacter TaxID=196816 RepID=UPI0029341486|nr:MULTISPECIES: hypothetical protein [unclassified Acinetobacter]WOE31467.1 hypothetical protein QSG84_14335 [Acinetobacter sp. SAAs470]WOE39663.1 hypothetical protein QSG86_08000 [Acinetobacter sp. SAAs474]
MRLVICCMGLILCSSLLVACGQTGALQLPNDPNYDKRAKYLLYPDAKPQQQQQIAVQQEASAAVATE